MLGKANITHLKDIRKGLMKERLIEYLSDDTSLAKEPKLPPSTVAKIAKPGKSAAAASGTQDADWLLGLEEALPSDDVAAAAAAEGRRGGGVNVRGGAGAKDDNAADDTNTVTATGAKDDDATGNIAAADDDATSPPSPPAAAGTPRDPRWPLPPPPTSAAHSGNFPRRDGHGPPAAS